MSSVIRANSAAAICATSARSATLSAPPCSPHPTIKTDAELKGGIFGISSAGSESNSATTLVLRRLGLTRAGRHREGNRHRAPTAAALRRGRGDRAGRAATHPGYRRWACASSPTSMPSGSPGSIAASPSTAATLQQSRHARALPQGHDRRQSPGDHRREARQGSAGERTQAHRSESHRRELRQFQSRNAAERRDRPHGAENVLTAVAPPNASRNLDDYIDTSLIDGLRADGFLATTERRFGTR